MYRTLIAGLGLYVLVACASSTPKPSLLLSAPPGTAAVVATQVERGNALFAAQQWGEAEAMYRQAIAAVPTLAEAHYNLAMLLYTNGKKKESRAFFMRAANLAPGHTVIWSAPPFREVDADSTLSKKTPLDAKPY